MVGVPTYTDQAVVLRTHKLAEADRIVTVLSRTRGKLRVVAKGVRRTKSRIGARLEPGMAVTMQCHEGRNLDTVTQVETLHSWGAQISLDYRAYTAAATVLEAADRLTEEHAPALQQYLLLSGRSRLSPGRTRSLARPRRLLVAEPAVAGWAPSFHDRARCGQQDRTAASISRAAERFCPECRPAGRQLRRRPPCSSWPRS